MAARTSMVSTIRAAVARDHEATPYYEQAETAELLAVFWGADSPFRRLFDQLDLSSVLELACGHGRHAAQILDRAGRVTLVDCVAGNLAACRKRFVRRTGVSYIANNGFDLQAVRTGSQTAVFSYDAMVHFELADVLSYINEIARVLKPGGRALLHYSANDTNPEASYRDCPHWRNFGSEGVVLHFAHRAGLRTIDRFKTSWPPGNGDREIDGVALFEKLHPA